MPTAKQTGASPPDIALDDLLDIDKMSLTQRLAKIRQMSDAVQKSRRGFNYNYSDITEILANVTGGMNRYRVSLIPMMVPGTERIEQNTIVNTKFDKTGKQYEQRVTEMLFSAQMVFRWVNDDNPSDSMDIPWFVTGSQVDPSQAFGSALTYCTRYFLTNYFQIAQPETDVDAYRTRQRAAEAAEDKAIADQIIGNFDIMLKQYLASNPLKSDEVRRFVARYVKGSDYTKIKEPVLAAKLLSDFKAKYIDENAIIDTTAGENDGDIEKEQED